MNSWYKYGKMAENVFRYIKSFCAYVNVLVFLVWSSIDKENK